MDGKHSWKTARFKSRRGGYYKGFRSLIITLSRQLETLSTKIDSLHKTPIINSYNESLSNLNSDHNNDNELQHPPTKYIIPKEEFLEEDFKKLSNYLRDMEIYKKKNNFLKFCSLAKNCFEHYFLKIILNFNKSDKREKLFKGLELYVNYINRENKRTREYKEPWEHEIKVVFSKNTNEIDLSKIIDSRDRKVLKFLDCFYIAYYSLLGEEVDKTPKSVDDFTVSNDYNHRGKSYFWIVKAVNTLRNRDPEHHAQSKDSKPLSLEDIFNGKKYQNILVNKEGREYIFLYDKVITTLTWLIRQVKNDVN